MPGAYRYAGTGAVVELRPIKHYDPATGWRTFRRWKGFHADIEELAETYVGAGVVINIDPIENTPRSILSVQQAGDGSGPAAEEISATWELLVSLEDEDNWGHPTPAAHLASLATVTARGEFVKSVDDYEKLGTEPPSYSGLSAEMKGFVLSRGAKDLTYFCPKLVLRLTRVVPRNSSVVVIDYGLRLNVFTTAELLDTDLIDDFPLPPTIGDLPDGQWLSIPPGQQDRSDGRVQIVYEFVHGAMGSFNTAWKYGTP